MTKLFGTDGIRGRAGQFPLDESTLSVIGKAIGLQLGNKIIIGQDPRESSPWIFEQLGKGLRKTKTSIQDTGILPTPAIALLTQQTDASGAVMISASHNPYEDNGIKIFDQSGRKLADEEERKLEQRIAILLQEGGELAPESPNVHASSTAPLSWETFYLDLLKSKFQQGQWLANLRIVTDCANGSTSKIAPEALRQMGAEVFKINAEPSGTNINEDCGAVHPTDMIAAVKDKNAHLGVAFDGDGDRALFASESGKLVDGDAILLMMARIMKTEKLLSPPRVVGTSMTNYSLEKMFAAEGIKLTRTEVGDRYVFQEMIESGSTLGGEPSGHIIFSDFGLSGDGLLTTLKVCEALIKENASLDKLLRDWQPAPQLLTGIPVKTKIPLDLMPVVRRKIDEIGSALKGRGRIVVRYSGTEPLLRVMIESDSLQKNDRFAAELIALVQTELANAVENKG